MKQLLKARLVLLSGLIVLCFCLFISSSLQASTNASPAGGPLAQSTVPTLLPLVDLTIANNGGSTQLDWSDSLSASSYTIHRSINPFFEPTSGTLLTTVSGATKTYTDNVGGIGNVNTNYFYIVTASAQSTTHYSNWVGEIDYALNNSNGAYNLIGIPFSPVAPANAASLATQLGNVNTILGWNPNTQSFKTFTPPNIGNFTFTFGDAIFIELKSGAPTSVNVLGELTRPGINLRPSGYNFLTMPLHCDELTTASGTASDIGGVANLLRWNRGTQSFQAFTPPNIGDFTLTINNPFIVELTASGPTAWPTIPDDCR